MRLYLCYNLPLGKLVFYKEMHVSQYYPQPGPFYPPEHGPEDDYYDEGEFEYEYDEDYGNSGNTLLQFALITLGGGCLVFLCIGCCLLLGTALWFLDPGSSLVSTPNPESVIGLTFDEPAFPDQPVVNEQGVRLAIMDVNRDAAIPDIPPVEGRELIIVTIELVNLGDGNVDFDERNFMLLNRLQEAYVPTRGTIDGALGRGVLPPDTGLQGRLVFEVAAGEFDLVLAWDNGPDSEPRYILLE